MPDPEWTTVHPLTARWKLKQIRGLVTSMPHLELTTVHPLTNLVKIETDLGSHHFSHLFTTDRKKFIT